MPVKNVKLTDTFWLKDTPYSLYDMFAEGRFKKGYAQQFVGGTVYQAFLSALFYHRWHSPVDGTIVDIYNVPGTYYLDQSQTNPDYDPASPDESQAFLSAVAARQVFIIDADN
jgi:phosphatidylserine decarboxylase